MITKDEIKKIFKSKIGKGKLNSYSFLTDKNLYMLNIDFDPETRSGHDKKTSNIITCIDGNSKNITYISMLDYINYDGEEIEYSL